MSIPKIDTFLLQMKDFDDRMFTVTNPAMHMMIENVIAYNHDPSLPYDLDRDSFLKSVLAFDHLACVPLPDALDGIVWYDFMKKKFQELFSQNNKR